MQNFYIAYFAKVIIIFNTPCEILGGLSRYEVCESWGFLEGAEPARPPEYNRIVLEYVKQYEGVK